MLSFHEIVKAKFFCFMKKIYIYIYIYVLAQNAEEKKYFCFEFYVYKIARIIFQQSSPAFSPVYVPQK